MRREEVRGGRRKRDYLIWGIFNVQVKQLESKHERDEAMMKWESKIEQEEETKSSWKWECE